jgi:hypothetical protein
MIRPLTVLGCLAFLGAGFHVYHTKAQVDDLGQELRRVLQATEAERVRSRVLSAEWARLNDQDRLSRLATTHLGDLQPTTPQQFVRVADAGRRLPGAITFTGRMSGFSARADAPSAPGEVLVFSARTMMADAAPARAPMAAADQPVALAAVQPSAPVPPATIMAQQAPQSSPATVAASAHNTLVNHPTDARPRPAPAAPVAATRAVPEPRPAPDRNLRNALHATAAAQPQPAPARVAPSNFAPPLGFAGGSGTGAMAGSMLVGGGALPPPMPFGR